MSDKFDLQVVHDNFNESLHEQDDVNLQLYLASYEELNKFFTLMGSVFSFVSSDLKSKINTVLELIEKDSDNFKTTKSMIEYEKNNNLLNKKGYVSGSRTLLRLHRGLDFIRLFLQKISDMEFGEATSSACRAAYDQTLAKHHGYLIAAGARLAMYALPNKEVLLKQVCGDEEEALRIAAEILPKTLEITASVYDRIENMYTSYNLHSLP